MVSMSMKPRLLFISPILPASGGAGVTMRPYYQIVNLSRVYSIHLLIAGTFSVSPVPGDDIKKYCDTVDYVCRFRYTSWKYSLWFRYKLLSERLQKLINGTAARFAVDLADGNHLMHNETLRKIAGMNFDRVHVFRFYLTPISRVLKNLGLKSFYSLDIDDMESETRQSLAGLHAQNGAYFEAARLNNESSVYFNIETKSLPDFDEIFVCSRHDRDVLKKRFPEKIIKVLPNVVPLRKRDVSRPCNEVFIMLFVGTLDYYPNTDALIFFAGKIVPELRKKIRNKWRLRVVGTVPRKSWIQKLKKIPEIEFAGWVEDLGSEYSTADVVIAPVRGGGGTRIKILEAFAYGVPVISTAMGCAGLDVENKTHLLIADDAEAFAEACARLMTDSVLRDEISRKAFDLAASKYSPDIVNSAWSGLYEKT